MRLFLKLFAFYLFTHNTIRLICLTFYPRQIWGHMLCIKWLSWCSEGKNQRPYVTHMHPITITWFLLFFYNRHSHNRSRAGFCEAPFTYPASIIHTHPKISIVEQRNTLILQTNVPLTKNVISNTHHTPIFFSQSSRLILCKIGQLMVPFFCSLWRRILMKLCWSRRYDNPCVHFFPKKTVMTGS
jgi:hypothetical protein